MKRLWVALSILGIGLALLIANHERGNTFGLANDSFESLVSLSAIAVLIGSGIVASRRQFGDTLRMAAVWLLIALALVSAYLYRRIWKITASASPPASCPAAPPSSPTAKAARKSCSTRC